jgi:pimeloyl-ACP methyl ester carboxylesterase
MDPLFEPPGFVVVSDSGDRIHFLDWGGEGRPPVLLIHGLSNTAWSWTPVARRLRAQRRVVAMDLRGHGLSDAPTGAYVPEILASDVVAVAEGAGLLEGAETGAGTQAPTNAVIVLAGHGFGGIVAAWAAAELGDRCSRLVLVDGGWENLAASTGMDATEFLRGLDEPPEVLRSMTAYLADRAAFDPASWDTDQERAARATVVETAAGKVVPSTRPHALVACVEAMFEYDPAETLHRVRAPIVALAATSPPPAGDLPPISTITLPAVGHNLMRYRPADVTDAILGR